MAPASRNPEPSPVQEHGAALFCDVTFVTSLFVTSLFVTSLFVTSLFVTAFFVTSLFVTAFFVISPVVMTDHLRPGPSALYRSIVNTKHLYCLQMFKDHPEETYKELKNRTLLFL